MLKRFLRAIVGTEDTTELQESVEELHKKFKRLEEEWTEVYHKFRTLQMRVAKQVQRLDANSSQEEPQGVGSEENLPEQFSSLSPRAREVQRQILARRARGQGNGGE